MSFTSIFNKATSFRKMFRYPSNVTPNRVVLKQTPSRTDVYATTKGSKNHSHTVVKDKAVVYSRTQGGNVITNKPSGGGCCPNCGRARG